MLKFDETTPDIPEAAETPETATETATETAATIPETMPILPPDYLSAGYYATTEKGAKYLRSEFVGSYAQEIATDLSTMRPADFAALIRGLRSAKKRTLPFEARQTAAAELLPKSLALVHRKKSPILLSAVILANLDAIHNDEDWTAFYRHMESIQGFLSFPKGGD